MALPLYKPFGLPPGGLLASTPDAPLPVPTEAAPPLVAQVVSAVPPPPTMAAPVAPAAPLIAQPAYNPGPAPALENDSVTDRMNSITASGSDYIKQAQGYGMKLANRRGLLNSSMAAGMAHGAALERALPLAQQEATQAHQRNVQNRDFHGREKLLGMELGSRETLTREGYMAENQRAALSYYAQMNGLYSNSLDNLWNNKDMPAPARDFAIQQFTSLRNTNINLPAALYGVNMDWGTTPTVPPPVAPPATTPAYGGNDTAGMSPEEVAAYNAAVAAGYGSYRPLLNNGLMTL